MTQRITKEQTEAAQFISAAKAQNFNWAKVKTALKFGGQNYFPIPYSEIQALRKRMILHHQVLKSKDTQIVLWY